MRKTLVVRTTSTATKIAIDPSSGRIRRSASRYAPSARTLRPASSSTSAQAVAAWTSPKPSSVSVVPTTTAAYASDPARSPVTLEIASMPETRIHCTAVMTMTIGIRSSPSPTNRRRRFRYIRADAERIWPHVRRRPTCSGATGVHVARTTAKTIRPRSTPSTSRVAPGFSSSLARAAEPRSTPEQKRSVAPVPRTPPAGTA